MTIDTKETRASKVWHKRVQGTVIREGLIRQFCHAVMPLAMGYPAGGHHTALTVGEAASIAEQAEATFRMVNGGYQLTDEHTEKGLGWTRRNPRLAERAGITQQMLDGFMYYRWVGTVDQGASSAYWGWRPVFLPVWEINYRDENGEHQQHDYWWGAWQSTGGSY